MKTSYQSRLCCTLMRLAQFETFTKRHNSQIHLQRSPLLNMPPLLLKMLAGLVWIKDRLL